MFFEYINGFRKVLMGLCMTGVGIYCGAPQNHFVVGIYACFCLANMIEHICKVFQKSSSVAPVVDLSEIRIGQQKVLETQATLIQALDFIVGFIKASQGPRVPS